MGFFSSKGILENSTVQYELLFITTEKGRLFTSIDQIAKLYSAEKKREIISQHWTDVTDVTSISRPVCDAIYVSEHCC